MAWTENIKVGVIGLVGALIGTGVGGLVTWQTTHAQATSAAQQSRLEFLRTQRRQAYADFLTKATAARDSVSRQPAALEGPTDEVCAYQIDLSDKYDAMSMAGDTVSLLGSKDVLQAMTGVVSGFDIGAKPACEVPGRQTTVDYITRDQYEGKSIETWLERFTSAARHDLDVE